MLEELIIKTAKELYQDYLKDDEVFKSSRNYPPKEVFFELQQLQRIFFPDFFMNKGSKTINEIHILNELTQLVDHLLSSISGYDDEETSKKSIIYLLKQMPEIRKLLKTDLIAAYAGDPAAPGISLIIRCYPGFQAIMIHRVAHALYESGEKYYSRELMENVHAYTAIDIHPGASIGGHFFIDHGVGVVIGETCIIGEWCRIYQSVTLGAMHFQEEGGILKRGMKRHPTVGDYVTIGTGAKVLGNIKVGNGVRIGANSWVSKDVEDNMIVYIAEQPQHAVKPVKVFVEKKSDEHILSLIKKSPTPSSTPKPYGENLN